MEVYCDVTMRKYLGQGCMADEPKCEHCPRQAEYDADVEMAYFLNEIEK